MEPADLELLAARAQAAGGAPPLLVAPVSRPDGALLALCAFADEEDASRLRWLLLAEDGAVARDRRAVRQAAELVAMCETGEEGAAALAADDARPLLEQALRTARELGHDRADIAAHAMLEALAGLEHVEGVRVADAAYLDRIALAAGLVGDRFDLLKETAAEVTAALAGVPGEPLEPLAEELWAAVRVLARDGAPDRFASVMEGALGVAAAFADDVLARYGAELEEEDG